MVTVFLTQQLNVLEANFIIHKVVAVKHAWLIVMFVVQQLPVLSVLRDLLFRIINV